MIQNVGAFTRNMEFSLLPLRSKLVSTTVPYFRPSFPVVNKRLMTFHAQHKCILLYNNYLLAISIKRFLKRNLADVGPGWLNECTGWRSTQTGRAMHACTHWYTLHNGDIIQHASDSLSKCIAVNLVQTWAHNRVTARWLCAGACLLLNAHQYAFLLAALVC